MTLKLAPPALPDEIPLTREQILILETLEKHGPTKALLFDAFESHLDDLYRSKPRLISIIPGHIDAVVDITAAGRLALNRGLS
jgi:hypothetical protein